MSTMMKRKQLNNVKELLAEKQRLTELSKVRKSRLDRDMDYFQQNAGSILLSTVSYHLVLKQLPVIGDFLSQREKNTSDGEVYPAVLQPSGPATALQKAGPILSMVWKVAQPIVVSVVLRRFSRLLGNKK